MSYSFSSLDELGEGPGFRKVRKEMGIEAFGVNGIVYPPGQDGFLHFHETQDELYFVHAGHARFRVDGHDVDAPAGTFVSALDVKTIRSAVALSDDTVVFVIGAEPGAPFEVTAAERAELAEAGVPANPA